MSLIAGASGSKTILTDGVQVNVINENTVTNGVQIQGRTSGTAIASGYVGQVISASAASQNLVSSGFQLIATIELTEGQWLVSGSVAADGSVATAMTGLEVNLNLNTNSLGQGGYGRSNFQIRNMTAGTPMGFTFPPQVVSVGSGTEKTCSVDGKLYGDTNKNCGHGYIVAVRIA